VTPHVTQPPLTRIGVRVLRTLHPDRYQTIDTVAETLGIYRSLARMALTQLRERGLAEDNAEHPIAFRRTGEDLPRG
jgi:predicted transcriptional regulator